MSAMFGRPSVQREVDDELAFHIEMTVRELMAHGMTLEAARIEAVRRFGDVKAVNAECAKLGGSRERRARRLEFVAEVAHDVRFALRQFSRAKGFAALAVFTLALGIGATTAVFGALYAVVLQPLPFDQPDRILSVASRMARTDASLTRIVPAEFDALRTGARSFSHVAASWPGNGFTITDGDLPVLVGGGRVSAAFFGVFGVPAALGRIFTEDDDALGRAVVVLSDRVWNARYHADVSIIGRTTRLNGVAYTIIGVMPPSFDVNRLGDELWVPLSLTPRQLAQHQSRYFDVVARVRAGVTVAQAQSEARSIVRAANARFPKSSDAARTSAITSEIVLTRYLDLLVGDNRRLLLIAFGGVGFVLLIACANVANLYLARGTTRARELAIRAALGAGRGRIVRQLLVESLTLAACGALAGLAFAVGTTALIKRLSPGEIPRLETVELNWPMIAFAIVMAGLASIAAGLLPAWSAARANIEGTLRAGGRTVAAGNGNMRHVLVALQVTLAMVLLTGAGLLLRSAWLVQQVDPGFDVRGVMTARLILPEARYKSGLAVERAYTSIHAQTTARPDVRSAAMVLAVPLSGATLNSSVFSDRQTPATDEPSNASIRLVSPDYFRTMGIALRAGRDVQPSDNESAEQVVLINEALASLLWPGEPSTRLLGRRMSALATSTDTPNWMTVVGIVANIRDVALGKPALPEFYAPLTQTPDVLWPMLQRSMVLVARTRDPGAPAEALERTMASVVAAFDPSLPLAEARSMRAFMRGSLERARFNTALLTTLGAIALTLAMTGVYGVVAWFVSQRTGEIGVRMAIGATPAAIWTFVMRRGLAPIVGGLLVGTVLSFATSRLLRDQLYGVASNDPVTTIAVAGLLAVVALVAIAGPARRAMRISPMEALAST